MYNKAWLEIEIAYVGERAQSLISLCVPTGATLAECIEWSQIARRHPELQTKGGVQIGVFGKLKTATCLVQAGDRVELYRPLAIDPMQARRQRVQGRA